MQVFFPKVEMETSWRVTTLQNHPMIDYIYGSLILIGLLIKYLNLDFRRQDRESGMDIFSQKYLIVAFTAIPRISEKETYF